MLPDASSRWQPRGTPRRAIHLIQRDNTYGTPEEDAFRRDFTVNALFYDIGTFSIIDYVGGLEDLDARLIRCIGDPAVRFLEDPVRMLRAVVLAARLQFTIDEPILDAIAVHRHEIARSAPARLVEEFYKILRSGHAEEAFRQLRATGLLKEITPELAAAPEAAVAVDRRARSLSRPVRRGARIADQRDPGRHAAASAGARSVVSASPPMRSSAGWSWACCRSRGATSNACSRSSPSSRGCSTSQAPVRAQRGLLHRAVLDEAITWLEIHGDRPEVVAHWRELQAQAATQPASARPMGPPRPRQTRRSGAAAARRRRGNYGARS